MHRWLIHRALQRARQVDQYPAALACLASRASGSLSRRVVDLEEGAAKVSSPEAAHIVPYANNGSSKVTNGLLLRGDLHTLFDLHLLSVDPDRRTVVVAKELQTTKAGELHGRLVAPPRDNRAAPTREVLARHHALAMAKASGGSAESDPLSDVG